MQYSLTQSSAPAAEPLTKTNVREQLRLDNDPEEDDLLDALITVARQWCEEFTGRQLITATWVLRLDHFPASCLNLPKAPLQSVTSVQYTDEDGNNATWASSNYQVDTSSKPGRLAPVRNASWPSARTGTFNAVTITYVSGYGAAGTDVPQALRQAMLLLIGHLYEHREDTAPMSIDTIPNGAEWLASRYRDTWFPGGTL